MQDRSGMTASGGHAFEAEEGRSRQPRRGPAEREPDEGALRSAIAGVRGRVAEACARARRDPAEVTIVAASKTVSVERVRMARAAGIEHFAENYARELAAKAPAVQATWHFVGKLQYATAPRVAAHAQVVHSAEPGRGLERLGRRSRELGRTMRCLVQVDFTGRRQGVGPDDVDAFVAAARRLPGIEVVGLMTLPPAAPSPELARPYFARLRGLRDGLLRVHPEVRELSMGMSSDYEVAVEEGATMVRVGTALFGVRPASAAVPGVAGEPSGSATS